MADYREMREMLLSNEYADYIVPYAIESERFEDILKDYGAQSLNAYYGLLHARRDEYSFPDIQTYGYSTIPKLFTLLDTTSLEKTGVLLVQDQPFLDLEGNGILYGFIDTGINYQHRAFRTEDGSSRILRIWDQTIQTGTSPSGQYFGSEYTKEDIDAALRLENPLDVVPSVDTIGHGTMISGICCGSRDAQEGFIGVAPRSNLVVVKLREAKPYLKEFYFANGSLPAYSEADIMLAIRYMADTARALRLPLVLCFSLGSNQGDHSGNAPIDNMLINLPSLYPRSIPVVAAGNESGMSHHFFGNINRNIEYIDVEILVKPNTLGFQAELWNQIPDVYSIGIISPLGETVSRIPARPAQEENITFVLDQSRITVNYELVQTTSGSQLILIRFFTPTQGIWKIRVYCTQCSNNGFHIWLPITGLCNPDPTFLEPNPYTTLTLPSNAYNVITSSTYSAYNDSIYIHSSRGYTRFNQIKPDFAAPGVDVMGPNLRDGYTAQTGSSVAAAISAGCAGLLLEWGLKRSPIRYYNVQEIKSFLIRGARRSPQMDYPNREWGYGALNIYDIFTAIISNEVTPSLSETYHEV